MISLSLAVLLAAAPLHVGHRKVATEDGASLALYSLALAPGAGRPVLLIADVGFGRRLFDRGGEDDLAHALVRAGHRVFIAELRGQGAADSAHSFRSTLLFDLPAIWKAIRRETREPIDLIAHGYLGSIALASTVGQDVNVRRVVALNTPMLAEPPTVLLSHFLDSGGRFSTLASSPEGLAQFEALFAHGSRADGRSISALAGLGTRDLGPSLSRELLSWVELGDLPFDDGTTVVGRLRSYDRPTLLMLGLANAFAPSEACTPLRELSKAEVTVRLFSRLAQGDDYAHASFFIGDYAQRQIYPEIIEFLR